MSDTGNFINYMMIRDTNLSTKNQQELIDLQGRADHIAKTTGVAPMSWYEFQHSAPPQESHKLRNALLWGAAFAAIGAAGAAIFAPAAIIAAAVSIGLLGAVIGAFSQTDTSLRRDLLSKYGSYLDQAEISAQHGVARGLEATPPLREGEHVERLRESQLAAELAQGRQ